MKKHLSVWMLHCRSNAPAFWGVLLGMAAVEYVLFLLLGKGSAPEAYIRSGGTAIVFGVACLLLTLLLCQTGCSFGAQPGNTIGRLRVSEGSFMLWHAVHNAISYLMLWGVQILVCMLLCHRYLQLEGGSILNVFLAFHRSSFLHSLVPFDETGRWVCNAFLVIGLSIACSVIAFWQRRGKRPVSPFVMIVLAAAFFCRPLGNLEGNGLLPIATAVLCWRMLQQIVLQRKKEMSTDVSEA